VQVDIDHADDVGAFEFILRYDPAVLRDPVIEPGSFLGSTGRPIICPGSIVNATLGSVRYGCASMGIGSGVSGAGVLATVTFAISGSGSTLLTFEKVLVVNANADDRCPCVGHGATIDVALSTPTPTSTAVPTTTPVRTVTAVPTRATTRTPVRSSTAAPTRSATRTPLSTATARPGQCADVTGDWRVTWRDALAEVRALLRHSRDARYDVNGDGRVDVRDLEMVVRQLGRHCHHRERG